MKRQQTEFYRLFSEHGTGDTRICISPQEIVMLIYIASNDLKLAKQSPQEYEEIRTIAAKGFMS